MSEHKFPKHPQSQVLEKSAIFFKLPPKIFVAQNEILRDVSEKS